MIGAATTSSSNSRSHEVSGIFSGRARLAPLRLDLAAAAPRVARLPAPTAEPVDGRRNWLNRLRSCSSGMRKSNASRCRIFSSRSRSSVVVLARQPRAPWPRSAAIAPAPRWPDARRASDRCPPSDRARHASRRRGPRRPARQRPRRRAASKNSHGSSWSGKVSTRTSAFSATNSSSTSFARRRPASSPSSTSTIRSRSANRCKSRICCEPKRRARNGHGVFEAALMGHDDVGVALHHQRGVRFANRLAGQVQPVEQVAFGIERRLGRVDVLAPVALSSACLGCAGQHAAAGADGPALGVEDRKHQPIAKPIVVAAAALGAQQRRSFPAPAGECGVPRAELPASSTRRAHSRGESARCSRPRCRARPDSAGPARPAGSSSSRRW